MGVFNSKYLLSKSVHGANIDVNMKHFVLSTLWYKIECEYMGETISKGKPRKVLQDQTVRKILYAAWPKKAVCLPSAF